MIIAPGLPPVQETRHSRELSRKIDQVVRDYQRDHPDASLTDVRIALMQMTRGSDSPDVVRRRRVLGVVLGSLVAGAFGVLATKGGGRLEGNTMTWQIFGVTAAVAGM